jgi:hypothetical protein
MQDEFEGINSSELSGRVICLYSTIDYHKRYTREAKVTRQKTAHKDPTDSEQTHILHKTPAPDQTNLEEPNQEISFPDQQTYIPGGGGT